MTQKRRADGTSIITRLHMVEGQLKALEAKIAEGGDCVAVLTQFKAARAGLERAFALFLEANLKRCVGLDALPKKARAELETITAELVR